MVKRMTAQSYPDMMPIDISFVFENEKPAGKHGFLKTDGSSFRFEDGTECRFWGFNLVDSANFPEHAYAEQMAQRLSQAGCNLVRLHMMDFEESTPNIFAFTKGRRISSTRALDPRSMDRLDYMIACLKKEGVYVYLDMMTYRKFKSGDGVPYAEELVWGAKPYNAFDPKLIELQKEYCTQLWTHRNPYTGLEYRDDPVFALTDITNENCLFRPGWKKCPYYEDEFRQLYRSWLEENGLQADWEACDMYEQTQPLLDFKVQTSERYYLALADCMRALGVKIPIAGTNWFHGAPGNPLSNRCLDFTDGHHYYYDWRWGDEDQYSSNEQINGYPYILQNLGAMRLKDKPFIVGEFDMPWPNSFRAEALVYYTAVGALQGWNAMTAYAYSYSARPEKIAQLGSQFSSQAIGGTSFECGLLSMWNDPTKILLSQHCALMLRRQDISQASRRIGVFYRDLAGSSNNAQKSLLEVHRLECIFDETEQDGFDEIVSDTDSFPRANPNRIESDNGQLWRDLKWKLGGVDTPRTKILYGCLNYGKGHAAGPDKPGFTRFPYTALDGLEVESRTDFGVLAFSSLTDEPIEHSDNILLSAVSRAQNEGAIFDGTRMLDPGHAPILAEVIEADIRLRTDRRNLKVWAVNAEGYYIAQKPVHYEDGMLCFTIGTHDPALQYHIVAE